MIDKKTYNYLVYCAAILGIQHVNKILKQVLPIIEANPIDPLLAKEILYECRARKDCNQSVNIFYQGLKKIYPDEYKTKEDII